MNIQDIEGMPPGTDAGDSGPVEPSESGSTSTGSEPESSTTDAEPFCGDGIVDPGESCDDAGASATCDADCTPAACGDGVLNVAAGEACDDGEETAGCNADCTPAACGDGVVNAAAGEACDDGGESATCNVDCTPAACGDGVFNASAGEECDAAGRSEACNDDCTLAGCGDGVLNATAGEECDDGGESAECNADCSFSACGDGITNLAAGEACDDAGPSMACNDDCTVAQCGDAHINPVAGEQCEGADLAGATCQTLGFLVGTLSCGAGCTYDTGGCTTVPPPPELALGVSAIKQLDFSWTAVAGADHYELLESAAPGEPYVLIEPALVGDEVSITVPLHLRHQASYVLRACNLAGCTNSEPVAVTGSLAEAVGYVKASNTGLNDSFGSQVSLSDDGNTMAVGAPGERSSAAGVDGDQLNDLMPGSGAVYVFVRDPVGGAWSQQAYVKASNPDMNDGFGHAVALSGDGNTLVVGAPYEDALVFNINGNQLNNAGNSNGAAYVFTRDEAGVWSQQAYIKPSSSSAEDLFGSAVALSFDGSRLAVSSIWEDSAATGIDGDQLDESMGYAGAVYVFERNGLGAWSQQAYVKASNTGPVDYFGTSLDFDDAGDTLAISASLESSSATGVGGNQADDSAEYSGAVYVYEHSAPGGWSQQAYIKASNTTAFDHFGIDIALSGDGDTLVVGAFGESSGATGIDGDQTPGVVTLAGAVYVFGRDGAGAWSQQAYVKSTNTAFEDRFGDAVALSGDGNVLAVSSVYEDGASTGIGGDQASNAASLSGAVYVLVRDDAGQWSHRAYVKASNAAALDAFGHHLALSGDGSLLAVGARWEDGGAVGIGGDQSSDAISSSGAVYLY